MATVSLSVDQTVVLENESVTYTATLSEALTGTAHITLSNGQTIIINGGEGLTTGTIDSGPLDEDVYVDPKNITVSISDAYEAGFPNVPIDINLAADSVSIFAEDNINLTCTGIVDPTDVNEDEAGVTFKVGLTEPVKTSVDVTLEIEGIPYTLHFAQGDTEQEQFIPTKDSDVFKDPDTITAEIVSITNGTVTDETAPFEALGAVYDEFEQLKVQPGAITKTAQITDTEDTVTVELSASPTASEDGGVITYTATLVNTDGLDVTGHGGVTVDLANGETINIAAGSASGSLPVTVDRDDVWVESDAIDNHIIGVTDVENIFEDLEFDGTSVTTEIADDNDLVTVELSASPTASEAGGVITYTATLVNTDGLDVTGHGGVTVDLNNGETINIAAGSASGTVDTPPLDEDDPIVETGEVITNSILSATSINEFENLQTDDAEVSTDIVDDNDSIYVKLITDGSTLEGGTLTHTAQLVDEKGNSVTVPSGETITATITYNGDGTDTATGGGVDYNGTTTVTFNAGEFEKEIDNDTIEDLFAEGMEYYTATVTGVTQSNNTYEGVAPHATENSVTGEINDNGDTVTVKLVATNALGDILGAPVTIEEEQTAYYKAILVDATDTEIAGATGTVAVTFTDGTAVRTGTAALGTLDFAAVDQTIALNTVFSAEALDDYIKEDPETFNVQLVDNSYSNAAVYENVVHDTTAVVTTIVDDRNKTDEDSVYVQLVENDTALEGSDLTHKVKLVDSVGNPVTVPTGETVTATIGYAGYGANQATEGADYTGTLTVDIAAGTSETSFNNPTIDDLLAEGIEQYDATLTNVVQSNNTYEGVEIDTAHESVLGNIEDNNDTVTVKLVATNALGDILGAPVTIEEEQTAYYKAILVDASDNEVSGATGTVEVSFSDGTAVTTGTSANGENDYSPAGGSTQTVNLGQVFSAEALDDYIKEDDETFNVQLTDGSYSDAATYENVAYGGSLVTTITDEEYYGEEDKIYVQLDKPDSAVEGSDLTHKVKLVDNDGNPVTVPTGETVTATIGYAGYGANQATEGADYTGTLTVDIAAGTSETSFDIPALNDSVPEPTEQYQATISSVSQANNTYEGVAIHAQDSVIGTIEDNSPVTLKLTGDACVDEGYYARYTASLKDADGNAVVTTEALTVSLSYDYPAPSASDADIQKTTDITIPMGQSSVEFQVGAYDDGVPEGVENFSVALDTVTSGGGQFGSLTLDSTAVETEIYDNAVSGDELVNDEYQTNNQYKPAVADLDNGGFVVTWKSYGQDGDIGGIYMQRYNSDREQVGGHILVNKTTDDHQSEPAVVGLPNSQFVIVWTSYNQDGPGSGVYMQRFNHDGSKIGAVEDIVNTHTQDWQSEPAVAMINDGNGYVVTWMSYGQDGSGRGVYMQRYDLAGTRQGMETQVNSEIENHQSKPSVAAINGGYVITWQSVGQDSDGSTGIYAQRFTNAGVTVGSEVQINTTPSGDQTEPVVTGLADGGYVVAWTSEGQDGSGKGVYMKKYAADGSLVVDETLVNSETEYDQSQPAITALADGGYTVTWNSYKQDGSQGGIFAQSFASDGATQGSETQINTTWQNHQSEPSIAGLTGGDFVVAWTSNGQDDDGEGVFIQKYAPGCEIEGQNPMPSDPNDDLEPNIFTMGDDISVNESEGSATFTVNRTGDATENMYVNYTTHQMTASVGSDYSFTFGALTFAPGEASKTITVPILDDLTQELSETFSVKISPTSPGILGDDGEQIVTILDNDASGQSDSECEMTIANEVTGTNGDDCYLDGTRANDKILGLNGDDNMRGFAGDDCMYGGDGYDNINGGAGNDTLIGGKGNDVLKGYAGDDTFIFNNGDGYDVIWSEGGDSGENTIRFGEGIEKDDIAFFFNENNGHVMIQYSDDDFIDLAGDNHPVQFDNISDSLIGDTSNDLGISQIELTDGSILDGDALEQMLVAINSYTGVSDVTDVRNDTDIMDNVVLAAWGS